MSSDRLALAARFAALMDRDRFSAAQRLLAPGCRYRFRGKTIVGAKSIMRMYRANSAKGRLLLDELRFESKIEGITAGAVSILYTDRLRKGRHRHVHRCRQYVRIEGSKIVEIRHSDLRGESRFLRSFFKAAGIAWKCPYWREARSYWGVMKMRAQYDFSKMKGTKNPCLSPRHGVLL